MRAYVKSPQNFHWIPDFDGKYIAIMAFNDHLVSGEIAIEFNTR